MSILPKATGRSGPGLERNQLVEQSAHPRNLPMPRSHWPAVFLVLALPGASAAPELQAPDLARQVTIHRDRWGIAHVVGKTDAATGFGFGYAQAEDNWPRLEENYLRALGRYAEVAGTSGVAPDRLNRTLEIPRLAREEYSRLDPRMRGRSEEHTSELQSRLHLVCRLLLEKKNK